MNEDGTWRYPTVIVTTPRQAGKSSLMGALLAHRAITQRDSLHWYTAQSALAAVETWGKWEYKLHEALPTRWRSRLSAGQQRVTFAASNGSIRVFPPTPKGLHGQQADTVILDEIWSFTPEQGNDLMQAVVPTQATRRMRQLFLTSTAGDSESVWFRSWVERGREAAENPGSGVAFFEWSAPDDAPHDDPATWAAYHPGYPGLIDDDAMRAALDQFGAEGFARGYLNQWPTAEADWRAGWHRLASGDLIPQGAPVFIAVDAHPAQRLASIAAAGVLDDGRIAVEVLDVRPGTDWVPDRLVELSRRHRCQVVVQRSGPLGFQIEELTRKGVRVIPATGSHYAEAVARFRTLAAEHKLTHNDDPRLNAAVANAVVRKTAERPVWVRGEEISPLLAAAFAVWQAATPPQAPVVVSLPRR